MNRRKFIRDISLFSASSYMLQGLPLQAFASPLTEMAAASTNDKVLVFIQLHGGNDGLNTIVPLDQYAEYYNLRANIALPFSGNREVIRLDSSLPENQQIGLHPDMQDFKTMYDAGAAAVVQNVGYENTNMSHFRSRDIYFMGGSYDDHFSSGWMGRFLEGEYPGYPTGYPNTEMPDPLALEFNNVASLAYHRESGIPAGISINQPQGFYDLINGVGINPPASFPNNYYGEELKYLMDLELKANDYAEVLQQTYDKGTNSVTYPSSYPLSVPIQYQQNLLSEQLRIIAKLLSGGSKTRIFIARIGGFDTHADQVDHYDPTMGRHAALLHHLTSAVKAFYDDLKIAGLDEKVLTLTFSEFGRRAYSNAGYGSDHGKAAPVLLFGTGLSPAVHGFNPDLSNLDNGNLRFEIDYRRLYASVLQDWFEASPEAMTASRFGSFIDQKLNLFGTATSNEDLKTIDNSSKLLSCYPNPVHDLVNFSFYLTSSSKVDFQIFSSDGKWIKTITQQEYGIGKHELQVDVSDLAKGAYIYRIKTESYHAAKQFLK